MGSIQMKVKADKIVLELFLLLTDATFSFLEDIFYPLIHLSERV